MGCCHILVHVGADLTGGWHIARLTPEALHWVCVCVSGASPEPSGAGCCRQPSDSVLPLRRSATPSIWPFRMTLVKLQPASCRLRKPNLSAGHDTRQVLPCCALTS